MCIFVVLVVVSLLQAIEQTTSKQLHILMSVL